MKTIIGTLFFLCATAAFSQNAPVLSYSAQPLQITDHPEHAAPHALAQEASLLGGSSYGYAKGEVPLAEFASPIYETPLGDLARAARKGHTNVPKAAKVTEN